MMKIVSAPKILEFKPSAPYPPNSPAPYRFNAHLMCNFKSNCVLNDSVVMSPCGEFDSYEIC